MGKTDFNEMPEDYRIARVVLMESIFDNIKAVGVDETLGWLKSRLQFEKNILDESLKKQRRRNAK